MPDFTSFPVPWKIATPADVGAVSKTGDTMTGGLAVTTTSGTPLDGRSSTAGYYVYGRNTVTGHYAAFASDATGPRLEFGNGTGLRIGDGATDRVWIGASGGLGAGAAPLNGGSFGGVVSSFGTTSAAVTIANASRQWQWGVAASIGDGLGLYDATAGAYRMKVGAAGDVAVGAVAPSPVAGSHLQVGARSHLFELNVNGNLYLASNAYYNGTNWLYETASRPAHVWAFNGLTGGFDISTAPGGAAGSVVTFTQIQTTSSAGFLTSASGASFNGGVGVGRTATGEILETNRALSVHGSLQSATGPKLALDYAGNVSRLLSFGSATGTPGSFEFYQASSNNSVNRTALTIDSGGNVGVGVAPSLATFQVSGNIRATSPGGGTGTSFVSVGGSSNFQVVHTAGSTRVKLLNSSTTGADIAIGNSTSDDFVVDASGSVQLAKPMRFAQYTLATLPSASAWSTHIIEVVNATGGAKLCRSSTAAWVIINTNTVVS